MHVKYRIFRGSWVSWESLFNDVAAFASRVGPKRLINIAHSESRTSEGVVTVWYWAADDEEDEQDTEAFKKFERNAP